MSGVLRYDIVTFNPNPPVALGRLNLTLESPWKYDVGVKPNINRATCSYLEFQKLSGIIDRRGDIEFWYASQPSDGGEPDVTLKNWRLVDCEVVDYGVTEETEGTLHGVTFGVYFADFRERFIFPRGGRMVLGLINAGEKPATSSDGLSADTPPSDVPEMSLSELIIACLNVMKVDPTGIPEELDDIDAPRNIQWLGSHAPTELAKLLDVAGCTFSPSIDGTGSVQLITTLGDPNITAEVVLPTITIPSIDRRGKTVIFTSFPLPIVETTTLSGPRNDRWYFVIQDSKNNWVTPGNCDLLQPQAPFNIYGINPNETIDSNLNVVAQNPTGPVTLLQAWQANFSYIDGAFKARMQAQAYRFIKLGDGSNPPAGTSPSDVQTLAPAAVRPILNQLIEKDGTRRAVVVEVINKSSWDDASQQFVRNPQTEFVPVVFLSKENIVQVFSPLISTTVSQTSDWHKDGAELPAGGFTVRYSAPQNGQDPGTLAWKPNFFYVGFRRAPVDSQGEDLEQLDDDEIQAALNGSESDDPDLVWVSRPELRLRIVDDNPINQAEITAAAKALAEKMLANSGQPTRIIRCRGFGSAEFDGLVTGIEWQQLPPMTIVTVNNWYRPGGMIDSKLLQSYETSGDFPAQAATQDARTGAGEVGANQPMVPHTPLPSIGNSPTCSTDKPVVLQGGAINPDAGMWDRSLAGTGAVVVTLLTGVTWNPTTATLGQDFRILTFDACGKLTNVSAEGVGTIDRAVSCT